MKYTFKQISMSLLSFRRPDSCLQNKPMTGRKPNLGLKFFDGSDLGRCLCIRASKAVSY